MAGKVAEIESLLGRDSLADVIGEMYDYANQQRDTWLEDKKELRNYLFATDTRSTSNNKLPWKNSTTLPKLAQIRDNLHANYMAALFPNDEWLKWEGYTIDDDTMDKRRAIQAYMSNKLRQSNFKDMVSRALYDYIDYGNVFGEVEYVREVFVDPATGEEVPGYVGPKALRISPNDIVFNPTAAEFKDTYTITRYIKTLGEIKKDLMERPQDTALKAAVEHHEDVSRRISSYSTDDFRKVNAFEVDGFGSLIDYFQSGYVELLKFEGTLHDKDTGELLTNRVIVVMDRSKVIQNEQSKNWFGKPNKVHVGWRYRPDNLYAMGPLDNLVGMQYRMDHLENLKADAMDLAVHPPMGVRGNIESFSWEPGSVIDLGTDGEVVELGKNLSNVLAARNEIDWLENKMEEMAGAPKTAMGFRTPGEKTAFEVNSLQTAASRIFQEKITQFEEQFIEPILNMMLEVARRNIDTVDIVRVMDDDIGVSDFLKITKADITATGKLRPIGARHFAATAQLVQNLLGVLNSAAGQDPTIKAHVSGKKLAKLLYEEIPGIARFEVVQDNIGLMEQAETQRLMNQIQQDLEVEAQTPGVGE